jgi:hypothetical protein
MTLTALKKNFHHLIGKVEDKKLLDQVYKALSYSTERKEGMLWESLSSKEKKILMKSYKESKNRKNLVSHQKVMHKYSKWQAS